MGDDFFWLGLASVHLTSSLELCGTAGAKRMGTGHETGRR